MVHTLGRGISEGAIVADLIDRDTSWWNTSLLREVFGEELAVQIGQTPISSLYGNDQHIWRCTKNEEFSVKSAYHLANSCFMHDRGESSNASHFSDTWKSIWRLKVPTWSNSLCGEPAMMLCQRKPTDSRRKLCLIHYALFADWRRKQ